MDNVSRYIVVDDIVQTNPEKYIHFLTHATDKLKVPDKWGSLIYTSEAIISLMSALKHNIPEKYFRILNLSSPVTITFENGESFKVTIFEHEGVLKNIMLHFEGAKHGVLYTGFFTKCQKLYRDMRFRRFVEAGIDCMIVDNLGASTPTEVSIEVACSAILDISRRFPEHQIVINAPPFMYEDYIVSLVNISKLKVFVNELQFIIFEKLKLSSLFESDSRTADVIIRNEAIHVDEVLRRFKTAKIITIQLISKGEPHQYFQRIGLYQVQWSPHPSLFQLYALIEFVSAKKVIEMFSNGPKLPSILTGKCRNTFNMMQQLKKMRLY